LSSLQGKKDMEIQIGREVEVETTREAASIEEEGK